MWVLSGTQPAGVPISIIRNSSTSSTQDLDKVFILSGVLFGVLWLLLGVRVLNAGYNGCIEDLFEVLLSQGWALNVGGGFDLLGTQPGRPQVPGASLCICPARWGLWRLLRSDCVPTRMMGALGQWHRISGTHFSLTFWKEEGPTTLKHRRKMSALVAQRPELVKLIPQGSQAPKCYLLHQFSSAERPFEHFSGKGLAGNRKPTGGEGRTRALWRPLLPSGASLPGLQNLPKTFLTAQDLLASYCRKSPYIRWIFKIKFPFLAFRLE